MLNQVNKNSVVDMKKLIVKDNALINASYNLDLVEQRLILLAIVEARESGKGINANDPLTVHADSYSHQFGVQKNASYQALKSACDGLFARQFSYQTLSEKGNIQNHKSRWVSEVVYVENEAIVKLIFSPAIIPLITRLEKQFTSYELEQASSLTSAYAVRLYELLIAWRSTGKTPLINLQELRHKLGVLDAEYKRMERFKATVLDLAVSQVNEHTDITVSYEQHKEGRTIVGFSFDFTSNIKKATKAAKAVKPKIKAAIPDDKNIGMSWNTSENYMLDQLLKKGNEYKKEDIEAMAIKKNSDILSILHGLNLNH